MKRQLTWIAVLACLAVLVFFVMQTFCRSESKSLAVGKEEQNFQTDKPGYPAKTDVLIAKSDYYNATVAKSSSLGYKLIETVTRPELIEAETQKALERRVGSKSRQPDKKEILSVNGRVLFSGYKLGKAYKSQDGAIVLSSYDSPDNQLANADLKTDFTDGKLDSNISSIWYIDPSGGEVKIGPQGIHSENPIISSDGKLIAFSGSKIDENGLPGLPKLFIYSIMNKSYQSIDLESKDRIVPLYWEREFLMVLQAHGENMTHAKISKIQIAN